MNRGGLLTEYGFDERGLPASITAGHVMQHEYNFDNNGNLMHRQDNLSEQKDSFTYDNLNRLIGYTVKKNETLLTNHSYEYNSMGNIASKSDIATGILGYGEDEKPPHALTSISDVNNNFPTANLSITYTHFNKIDTLSEDNRNYTVLYGIDDERRRTIESIIGDNDEEEKYTRYYIGNYEEEYHDGNIKKIHYLRGGAIYIENTQPKRGQAEGLHYGYYDYLGSLIALADEEGAVVERYAYDAWGKRRNPDNWAQGDMRTNFAVNRGYTMHEHLDEFGIINMNGRVYDPWTASFFSPDPYIQAPDNWLNYNRYAYCYGNPFKYTDPSGEIIGTIIAVAAIIGAAVGGYQGYKMGKENGATGWDMFGHIAGGVIIGGVAGGASAVVGVAAGGSLAVAGIGGFGGGVIAGGAAGATGGFINGAGMTALGGGTFGEAMSAGGMGALMGVASGAVLGGVSGGISAVRQGRNFWNGAMPMANTSVQLPKVNTDAMISKPKDVGQVLGNKVSDMQTLPNRNNGIYTLEGRSISIANTTSEFSTAKVVRYGIRGDLIKASGMKPGKSAQAHHVFPVKYAKEFMTAGIDVNKYGAWWNTATHQQNAYQYNMLWGEFFEKYPNPTQTQIFNKAIELKNFFGD